MYYDAFELTPGEVAADRYDPADEQLQPVATLTVAELTAWDADPWF